MAKRLFDIIASGIGLLLLAPVIATVAFKSAANLVLRYFFVRYVRKDGKPFEMIKFRTMRDAVDEAATRYQTLNA